ncbi:MAG TPA: sodium/solute symporter [Spirochaetota bacterium]|nr:sodium/solute symporter [Spirochaetota bacterium]HPD06078.1 sodium/solute symporter [Spirochaetota bacterium]
MWHFAPTNVHWIDITLIVLYLAGITVFGFYYKSHIKTAKDYFLANRSLPWWVIGLSIIGTNIGSNDYIGAAGNAYSIGIAQANFEWIGAIPAMILSALIFIPFFWRAGVYSIPEYLGLRYNNIVRFIAACVMSIFSVVIVGVFLWATAIMLQTYLGWPVWFSIFITATVVGFYTISGGLGAVAITDTIQVFIMFFSAIIVAVIGIKTIGGFDSFIETLKVNYPDHLNAFLPANHPAFPWHGVILGLGLVLSPAYWCANQAILQRTFGARSEWDGKASLIFAAMLKTFVPFLIVMPGLLALTLAGKSITHQDQALPWVIKNVLPAGISGLMFVAFIAALQSSIDSTMNSTSVMIVRDIINVVRKEKLSDALQLKFGRIFTFCILIIGVIFAPITAYFQGIYVFIQYALSLFQGPIFALMIFGILDKRITATAGVVSLLTGLCFAALLGWFHLNMLYIAFFSFCYSAIVLYIISTFTKKKSLSELKNVVYSSVVNIK